MTLETVFNMREGIVSDFRIAKFQSIHPGIDE